MVLKIVATLTTFLLILGAGRLHLCANVMGDRSNTDTSSLLHVGFCWALIPSWAWGHTYTLSIEWYTSCKQSSEVASTADGGEGSATKDNE